MVLHHLHYFCMIVWFQPVNLLPWTHGTIPFSIGCAVNIECCLTLLDRLQIWGWTVIEQISLDLLAPRNRTNPPFWFKPLFAKSISPKPSWCRESQTKSKESTFQQLLFKCSTGRHSDDIRASVFIYGPGECWSLKLVVRHPVGVEVNMWG